MVMSSRIIERGYLMSVRSTAHFGLLAGRLLVAGAAVAALAGWLAPSATAGWRLNTTSTASVAYNQGVTFDQAGENFYFAGVSSTSNSALYRTRATLSRTGSNTAVIPQTPERYNHVGDLTFDARRRQVLLPLECYYPNAGGNTCGVGGIGVVNPDLSFHHYVNLAGVTKAMWVEIDPAGDWVWTSNGRSLMAYDAAQLYPDTVRDPQQGPSAEIPGTVAGVLPTSAVTGAAFYRDQATGNPRLLLALNRGSYFELVSYKTGTANGLPTINDERREASITKTSSNYESEGLAVTDPLSTGYPLGGMLHWQTLPYYKLYSRILNYMPA